MEAALAKAAEWVDEAWFQGRLYRVARYPGVVASDAASDRVIGDVWRLSGPDVLARLDRYEACDPQDPASPYVREEREIRLAAGGAAQAWIYLYNRPTAELELIPSGDFLASRHDRDR